MSDDRAATRQEPPTQGGVIGFGRDRAVLVHLGLMVQIRSWITLEDYGRLTTQIARAGSAKRPSVLQRELLRLVSTPLEDLGTIMPEIAAIVSSKKPGRLRTLMQQLVDGHAGEVRS